MDREGIVSYGYERDYKPIQPRGTDWRGRLRKAAAPLIAVGAALAKWSFVLVKFSSIFIAVGGYALIWGWGFGVGFVALLLLHELGHFIEAKREGLNPKLPVFIPFLGAYVRYTRGHPWQTARVALAGPVVGGLGALAFLLVGFAEGSHLLQALGYVGFFLNLINLIPIGILDGGAVLRSARWLRVGGGRDKALIIYVAYFTTVILLAVGMFRGYVPQHRL
jgi:Zn-dependent protease